MNILKMFGASKERQQYRDRGYFVFRDALPVNQVDALANLAHHHVLPYQGPILRRNAKVEVHDFFERTTLISNAILNAHLPISEAMRPVEAALTALITSPAVSDRLQLLDGPETEHYNIHQTLLFFAAQTTEPHIDSWGLDTAPRGFAHTVWIPLQDMTFRSGLPSVVPWPQGKVVSEAELGLPAEGSHTERYDRYQQALAAKLLAGRPEAITSPVRRGDFIVWSSLTPHFTLPSLPFPVERLSLQVLLRPLHLRWGHFLDQPSDHPTNRHIRINERFSYFVNEDVSRDHGIAGSLPTPAI
jgi:hypothetical protein